MVQFSKLSKVLETTLGPGMLFGVSTDTGTDQVHPCEVTAGVLRGERSKYTKTPKEEYLIDYFKGRFQLFGDTVNVAARMESTGQSGRVQISSEVADVLLKRGKEFWLIPRNDTVLAKGKGMTTIFSPVQSLTLVQGLWILFGST